MEETIIKHKAVNLYVFIAIGLISCSMLAYEILLTRICSLRLFFHFGFLIVSNCLLGIGASGSMVAILQSTFAKRVRFWIWIFSMLYLFSLIWTYVFLITYNIERVITLASPRQVLSFTVFNLVAAIPFFFSGSIIGLILTFNADQVNKIYCIDLLGAGAGCLLVPFFLWQTGAGGCVIIIALLALAGFVVVCPPQYKRVLLIAGGVAGLVGFWALPNFDTWFPVPCKKVLQLDRNKTVNLQNKFPYSRWSANSRIDLFNIAENNRWIMGMGIKGLNDPLPEEKYILQDGSAGTFVLNFSENPQLLPVLKKSCYTIAPMLKKRPRVFIIGCGGGIDVWAAKLYGAQYIKAVDLNQQILDIHKGVLYNFSKNIIDDKNIEIFHDEGRSSLLRDKTKYDIIQMTGIDTYTALNSGSYVLAENYLYTIEAFQNMYDRLADGGILSVTRLSAEMEGLRLLTNIEVAIRDRSTVRFENSVVCLSTMYCMTTLVKKGEFTADELHQLDLFSENSGSDFLYHPSKPTGTTLEKFIRMQDKDLFISEFPRNISPLHDDQPYFFNYMKWTKLFEAKQYLSEHPALAQGNPLFIFGQLLLSTALAVIFILLPVLGFRRKGISQLYLKRFLIYFSGLGLGFIFIEISLMQKLVLLLGNPLYSITVTLFAMLVFTGFGSLMSERWFSEPTTLSWLIPAGLAMVLGLLVRFSPQLIETLIIWPKFARITLTICILAPIGLLLGIPFAYGIRLLNRFNPTIIPWAWAVNGCMTVIGSILTVIVSMNFGFNVVLIAAILIYFMSFIAVTGLK